MPYITQDRRKQLNPHSYDPEWASTPGELNYQITELIKQYWKSTGNYQGINDIVGVLEGAKLEFYRRIAVPYEDKKIAENGDVY
jgi:SLT domain-containing protein